MKATKLQFTALNELYNYYNRKVFGNTLPEAIVSIVRSRRFHGAFSPNKWKQKESDNDPIHEIFLNASSFRREEKAWHSTLVHELVHLQEFVLFGRCGSRGNHTKRWGRLMKAIGLYPSSTGKPEGQETGRRVSHYVVEGGRFEKAFEALRKNDIAKYKLPYESIIGFYSSAVVAAAAPGSPQPESRAGVKIGYEGNCGNKERGK